VTSARVQIEISAEDLASAVINSRTVPALRSIDSAAKQSAGGLNQAAGGVKNFIQTVGSLGMGVFGIQQMGMAVKQLGSEVFGSSIQFEQFEMQFATLMKSTGAAKDRMRELTEFARQTPFELPDVVEASRILQVFGGDALATGDSLKMVGDAAAGTGRQFSEVAFWVGRMQSGLENNLPVGEATLRLQEMGIISGDLKVKLDELQDAGKGQEAWMTFASSAADTFGGGMERLSKSAGGALSNIVDGAQQAKRELMSEFFEDLKPELLDLAEYLASEDFKSKISDWGHDLAETAREVQSFVGDVKDTIDGIRESTPYEVTIKAFGEFDASTMALLSFLGYKVGGPVGVAVGVGGFLGNKAAKAGPEVEARDWWETWQIASDDLSSFLPGGKRITEMDDPFGLGGQTPWQRLKEQQDHLAADLLEGARTGTGGILPNEPIGPDNPALGSDSWGPFLADDPTRPVGADNPAYRESAGAGDGGGAKKTKKKEGEKSDEEKALESTLRRQEEEIFKAYVEGGERKAALVRAQIEDENERWEAFKEQAAESGLEVTETHRKMWEDILEATTTMAEREKEAQDYFRTEEAKAYLEGKQDILKILEEQNVDVMGKMETMAKDVSQRFGIEMPDALDMAWDNIKEGINSVIAVSEEGKKAAFDIAKQFLDTKFATEEAAAGVMDMLRRLNPGANVTYDPSTGRLGYFGAGGSSSGGGGSPSGAGGGGGGSNPFSGWDGTDAAGAIARAGFNNYGTVNNVYPNGALSDTGAPSAGDGMTG
jgi:hypothetical protein